MTQGAHGADYWLTSYKLQYSVDGSVWKYIVDTFNQPIIFKANYDRHTHVENALPVGLIAKFIALRPVTWHQRLATRMDVKGGLQPGITVKRYSYMHLITVL